MSTISGWKVFDKNMSHWNSIAEEWILAHERFARICLTQGIYDAAYWYTERTNVGILSGAAWRCGMIALEEYQTPKSKISDGSIETSEPDEEQRNGRGDLWIARDEYGEFIEAKQRTLTLNSQDPVHIVSPQLSRAVGDAHNVIVSGGRATGILFVPVVCPSSNYKSDQLQDSVPNLINTLSSNAELGVDFIAWCFPASTRKLIGPAKKYNWPGIIMLGKSAEE